jgi:hypothetical protein
VLRYFVEAERPLQNKPSYRDNIRSIAWNRDVEYLLHFTQFANLAGIVENGLLSRRELQGPEHQAYAIDQDRMDGNDEAVSVSISRINLRMFAYINATGAGIRIGSFSHFQLTSCGSNTASSSRTTPRKRNT